MVSFRHVQEELKDLIFFREKEPVTSRLWGSVAKGWASSDVFLKTCERGIKSPVFLPRKRAGTPAAVGRGHPRAAGLLPPQYAQQLDGHPRPRFSADAKAIR